MVESLLTAMYWAIFLSVIFLQGVCGTFFPPVSNPPPIPGQAVRTLDTSPQKLLVQEDLPQDLPQTFVKEGLFSGDANLEPRWYIQENQSGDTSAVQSSVETFDRYYPNGEPAIGPVATPLPDDTYVAQSSIISNLNPNDPSNSGVGDIWVLTGGPENQYGSERWIQIQVPSERLVEVVNQETGPPLAAENVKSIVAPITPDVPVKGQLIPDAPPTVVQQVWVRAPDVAGPQKSSVVAELPAVKQVVEFAPPSVKQVVQQQIVTKEALPIPPPFPLAPAPAVVAKSEFSIPPPPPPPLKGLDVSPKVISPLPANIVPDPNVLTPSKSGLPQQVRHIWIPTSSSTGKFISVPVSPLVDSGKSVPSKGIPQNLAPISVSDTWVLKQDGPIPSFEQIKSAVPPPIIQSGKVVAQDPPVLQVDNIPAPPVVTQVDSPKGVPIVSKSTDINVPVGLWPPRKDISTSKILGKAPVVLTAQLPPPPPPKTETVVVRQSFPVPSPISQKTLISSPKTSPFPPPVPRPAVQIVNGKPCPIPPPVPQKSMFPSSNPSLIAVPRFLTRKQPLTRIIRVNRYPTGSYYLLNTGVRPNIFTYPNPSYIRQSRSRLVRLVQAKQAPIQIQGRPVIPAVQTKQISIPVQSKVPAPVPAKQVVFPFSSRQLILPVSTAKSQSRIVYPAVQAVRFAYPWNSFLKPNPVPGLRVMAPQLSTKKSASKKKTPKSVSSSSESSSESSAESEKEEKKEVKKERLEEKPQSEEESSESSREKESKSDKESESKSAESKSEDSSKSESDSKESIETAESQLFHTRENIAILPKDSEDTVKTGKQPYMFRFDHRDGNGTVQHHQEFSDTEGRVTGTYGYHDPEGVYRIAQYIADSDGFRVNLNSNEPGTVSHGSAHANFISNQMAATEKKSIFETGESTDRSITTEFHRD